MRQEADLLTIQHDFSNYVHLQKIQIKQAHNACYKMAKELVLWKWGYKGTAPERWLTVVVKREASVGEEKKCCAGRAFIVLTRLICLQDGAVGSSLLNDAASEIQGFPTWS